LNCSLLDRNPPIVRHFNTTPSFEAAIKAPVLIRDPETGKIMGPYPLITWGRGYACVSTERGPRCIPAKNVWPFNKSLPQASEDESDRTQYQPSDQQVGESPQEDRDNQDG